MTSVETAVIVDALRTPIGRYGGALKDVRPDDLAALVVREAVQRNALDPAGIEDVYFGDANQAGEDNRNVARMAVLLAGLPVEIPAATMNRLCGSGMQAVVSATREIETGNGACFLAGGVESMTRAPFILEKAQREFPRGAQALHDSTLGWRWINPRRGERYPPISLEQRPEAGPAATASRARPRMNGRWAATARRSRHRKPATFATRWWRSRWLTL